MTILISSCHERILFLFTYAKIQYVSVRKYLSKNRIRTLRILEHCEEVPLKSPQIAVVNNPLSFEAPAKRNPCEYPHMPYIFRN